MVGGVCKKGGATPPGQLFLNPYISGLSLMFLFFFFFMWVLIGRMPVACYTHS
jgi:hypothetical protein